MVNPEELAFFECIADSNPPNTCVWISKTKNGTEVLMTGPRFEVKPYELPQGKEFLCRAFNNMTKKHDETKFTLVMASLDRGMFAFTVLDLNIHPHAKILTVISKGTLRLFD